MPSKKKKMVLMLARGSSQNQVVSTLHVSKRDVSNAAKALADSGLDADAISMMTEDEVKAKLFPRAQRQKDERYLQPDMEAYVSRKLKNQKLPILHLWYEYCEIASGLEKEAYSYQTFCTLFDEECKLKDVVARMVHEPGGKLFIDWAGDTAYVTDKVTGRRTKAYLFVTNLPYSGLLFAEAFPDMAAKSWIQGNSDALDYIGAVPHVLIPDNCLTAVNREGYGVTSINKTYEQFAEHNGTAILPTRVRKPRDKSTAESGVDLVEKWIIAPSLEQVFYTFAELNEYVCERLEWLNTRSFSEKEGSRRELFEASELDHMLPLPPSRFEICEWRQAKVAPNYHIRVDYMHYSVSYELVGRTCTVRLTQSAVAIMHNSETVAEHPRLFGARGQYHTLVEHMPANHRDMHSPWSPERFRSWAQSIGKATASAIERVLASKPVIEQTFVSCGNILGLSKKHGAALLERACAAMPAPAVPSYTSVKNKILAIKAADKTGSQTTGHNSHAPVCAPIDRALKAGRLNGAAAYRRKGADVDAK